MQNELSAWSTEESLRIPAPHQADRSMDPGALVRHFVYLIRSMAGARMAGARMAAALLIGALAVSWAVPANAQFDWNDEDDGPVDMVGHLKSTGLVSWPYDHLLMPEDPSLFYATNGRLVFSANFMDLLSIKLHPVVLGTTAGLSDGATGITRLSGAVHRDEVVDLSYAIFEGPSGSVLAYVDRAFLKLTLPFFDFTFGRQPITFGKGLFFTPLDIVNPFSPATIDREYKPGVDALRGDVYMGTATQITAVAAYAGDWEPEGLIFALHGRTTFTGFDMGLFGAWSRGDGILGWELAGDIYGVEIHAETTGTVPDSGSPFLRSSMGTNIRYHPFFLALEFYGQSLGESDPDNYIDALTSKRMERGEIWLLGKYYGAASASWEITPLFSVSVSAIVNLLDASVLVSPGISWSLADEIDLRAGAQIAQGERPADVDLEDLIAQDGTPKSEDEIQNLFQPKSEFGMYPATAFLEFSMTF